MFVCFFLVECDFSPLNILLFSKAFSDLFATFKKIESYL